MVKFSWGSLLSSRMNSAVILAVAVLISNLFCSTEAFAHRVIIFGWVEGERVITQSRFSNKRAVKGGDIAIFDKGGNRILSGKTDTKGEYSFQIPGKGPLKILLTVGSAHQAKWTVSEAELALALIKHKHKGDKVPQGPVVVSKENSCQQEVIEAAIEKTLDQKLRPVLKYVVESRNRPVSVRDVFGGIGYIIGLVGLAAYMRFRSEKGPGS